MRKNRVDELFECQRVSFTLLQDHVDNSIKDVTPFISSNVIGTINLLNASVKHEVEGFHHISTDEVYSRLDDPESRLHGEITESVFCCPKSLSMITSLWHITIHMVCILQLLKQLGKDNMLKKLIPKTISNIKQGKKKIPVYGKGENIRDWIYVEDHCRAILDVYFDEQVTSKYNVGGECEVKNIDLVKTIMQTEK